MAVESLASYCIVGVVGHIDHGKTSLVKRLTGTDTDTHPEEKQRGITIDLGFASFEDGDFTFAMIDAPGHRRYIGNLLAGVSQVGVGLLVVAGDQGIEAQTLEHAGVLRALGVQNLIVAISRIDLCSPSQVDELSEELELFLADEGFEAFPIVPLSVVNGAGLDELKTQLRIAAESNKDVVPASASSDAPFRMPIDRIFSVPGRGCVVAGTIWSGSVADGDTVMIAGGQSVRVRELENHGARRESSLVGRRTAMNLAGVSANDVNRGDELVSDERLQPVHRLLVELTVHERAGEIRCPATAQFHSATTSCEARIMGCKQLSAGDVIPVVVETEQAVVATFGQRCLFRRPYPVGSFAFGKVLAAVPVGRGNKKRQMTMARQLAEGDATARLIAWVDHLGQLPPDEPWLPLQIGVSPETLAELVHNAVDSGSLRRLKSGEIVSGQLFERVKKEIVRRLGEQAAKSDNAWIKTPSLVEQLSVMCSTQAATETLQALIGEKVVVTTNGMVALATDDTQLSKKQRGRLDQILQALRGNRTPSQRDKLAGELSIPKEQAQSLIRFATQQGLLIDIGGDFTFHSGVIEELTDELRAAFAEKTELTVADIRDHWQLSRKHVVPLLEFFDQSGITHRQDSLRTLAGN